MSGNAASALSRSWAVAGSLAKGLLLPDFDPGEFRTLDCREITEYFNEVRNIPYYSEKDAEADPYIGERCKLDIFFPTHRRNVPVLVFFPGGGLVGGSKDVKMELYKHLGCVIVTPDYRLSPRAKCPDYIEDAAAAAAWVKRNIAGYNGDPEKIFISGHSAGAYLVACLATMPRFLNKLEFLPGNFSGFLSISGEMVTHRAICDERGLPKEQIVIDEYAPLNHASKDVPHLLLLTGEAVLEIDNRAANNKRMAAAMRGAGNEHCRHFEVPGTDHGSILDAAYAYLLRFIGERVQK